MHSPTAANLQIPDNTRSQLKTRTLLLVRIVSEYFLSRCQPGVQDRLCANPGYDTIVPIPTNFRIVVIMCSLAL